MRDGYLECHSCGMEYQIGSFCRKCAWEDKHCDELDEPEEECEGK